MSPIDQLIVTVLGARRARAREPRPTPARKPRPVSDPRPPKPDRPERP
ncbi:hypothetical protein [Amycolatopsis vancoresmycina]|nr:hypothetical protein [Amycolatopsis vancoresmycina]